MTVPLKVRVSLKKKYGHRLWKYREVICIDGDSGRKSGLERTFFWDFRLVNNYLCKSIWKTKNLGMHWQMLRVVKNAIREIRVLDVSLNTSILCRENWWDTSINILHDILTKRSQLPKKQPTLYLLQNELSLHSAQDSGNNSYFLLPNTWSQLCQSIRTLFAPSPAKATI